jgi:hypothetical protein
MKTGVELIAEERQEQIEKHGFDATHDDDQYHSGGELIDAVRYLLTGLPGFWPKSWDKKWEQKFAEKMPGVETLKVAGALIAAEIDRLQRQSH